MTISIAHARLKFVGNTSNKCELVRRELVQKPLLTMTYLTINKILRIVHVLPQSPYYNLEICFKFCAQVLEIYNIKYLLKMEEYSTSISDFTKYILIYIVFVNMSNEQLADFMSR